MAVKSKTALGRIEHRLAVRTTSGTREAEINACTDACITPWPEQG